MSTVRWQASPSTLLICGVVVGLAAWVGFHWAGEGAAPPMPAAFQLPACDFGLMVPGAVSFKTMEVSNDGSAPIVFGDPKSSCACLEVRLDSHRVEPGQVVKVHLKLEERKPVGEVIYQFWIPQEAGGVVSGVGLF